MKFVARAVSAAFLCAASTAAQINIDTPLSVVVCRPLLISWGGGTPPYYPVRPFASLVTHNDVRRLYLSIHPGDQPTAPALIDFGTVTGTSLTWIVNISAGTSLGLNLLDSTGAIAHSSTFIVQASSNTSCLSGPSISTSPSTSTATIATTTTTPVGYSSPNATNQAHKEVPKGAIVGGAVGGVVVIVVVLLFLLTLRRHRKRSDIEYKSDLDISSGYEIEQSNTPPDALVSFQNFSASAQPLPFPPAPTDPSFGNRYGQTSMSFENENSVSGMCRGIDAGELIGFPSTNPSAFQPEFPAFTTSSLPKDGAPHHVARHEDSGVRFPAQESLLPVELPPLYTPL